MTNRGAPDVPAPPPPDPARDPFRAWLWDFGRGYFDRAKIKDLAADLNVSPMTVRNWRDGGTRPALALHTRIKERAKLDGITLTTDDLLRVGPMNAPRE